MGPHENPEKEPSEVQDVSLDETVARHRQALEGVATALQLISYQLERYEDGLTMVALLVVKDVEGGSFTDVMAKYEPAELREHAYQLLADAEPTPTLSRRRADADAEPTAEEGEEE